MNDTDFYVTFPVMPYYSIGNNIPDIIYFYLVIQITIICVQIHKFYSVKTQFNKNIKFSMVKSICNSSTAVCMIANIVTICRYENMNDQIYLFVVGYGNYIVQVCDNVIFILGYRALYKNSITNGFIGVCIVYIFIFLTLTWLPVFVVLPYVKMDVKNSFIQIYEIHGTYIYTFANILYNLFFTAEFTKIMYYYHRNINHISYGTYKIAVKCFLHCVTSNIAIFILIYYNVNSVESSCMYIFILSTSMNILFNINVEQKTSALYRSVITVVYSIQKNGSEISLNPTNNLNTSAKSGTIVSCDKDVENILVLEP